ncbi:CHAD domain-containing protein [Intrasporangium sp.]|uniref:CHAD domain-containing protein n=1 Tax=Intrasporangium sp. TaxID=1925024 RepID=UPI003221F553
MTGDGGAPVSTADPVRTLVLLGLRRQLEDLREHSETGRDGPAARIHDLRADCRRLRSLLGTFAGVFRAGPVGPVCTELRWVGHTLGRARDAQVLHQHLEEILRSQPPQLVLGPVPRRLHVHLAAEERVGTEDALAALHGPRYARLVDRLESLAERPPWSPRADERIFRAVPRLLRVDARRLERAQRRMGEVPEGPDRDAAAHETRKKAKRYRYAAEALVPAYGHHAELIAARAQAVQRALGEHHDAGEARVTLRRLAVQAHEAGEDEFTYGRLDAFEQARAARALAEFERAWRELPRRHLRRVLRG